MSDRLIPTLIVLAVGAAGIALMFWGYRNRRTKDLQVLATLPSIPADLAQQTVLASAEGIYVSTTVAGDWLARINSLTLGSRSKVQLQVFASGVYLERTGARSIFLPIPQLELLATTSGMAGKFMGQDAIFLLRWNHEGSRFDTGVHLRYKKDQQHIENQVQSLIDHQLKADS